jgi:predicted transcriptional regulator YdeE/DNA-binding transcriptional MerR regulator
VLKIGEFSKLTHVTVKTLRHYSQVGLLMPAHIDRFTGYRYYVLQQLPRLNRILALKDIGFSLQEIADILRADVTMEQMSALFSAKQSEMQQRLKVEQSRLDRIEMRLKQIEQEGKTPEYDLLIKCVPNMDVIAIREIIPDAADVPQRREQLHSELTAWIRQKGLKADSHWLAITYNHEYSETNVDLEVAIPLAAPSKRVPDPTERVALRTLEGRRAMVSVLHVGKRAVLSRAYAELINWIQSNGYIPDGPYRELMLKEDEPDADTNLIEVQLPVEKALRHLQNTSLQLSGKDNKMEPRFETRPAFMVVGMMYRGKNENLEINAMWNDFIPRFNEINDKDLRETFGVCRGLKGARDGEFEYVAGVRVKSVNDLPEDMVVRMVPEQKYAVFTHRGALEGLRAFIDYIYQSWLPQSGFELTSGPDLEVYDEKFKYFAEDSEFYILLPIK